MGGIVAVGLAMRLAYMLHGHPFVDEFTSILAAQAILQHGLPVLPSGLFYDHGLLFTYLAAPWIGLAHSLGADSLFVLARLPSLIVGVATIPLLYWIGRRWVSPQAGLVAAALLAVSPEGMVWAGRARMYALAGLLALLLAFFAFEGSRGEGRARMRWLAWPVLLAALLTQFGAIILAPAVGLGMLAVGWLTRPNRGRPWFLRPAVMAEGVAVIGVVGLGLLVKRLGQPMGAALLGSEDPAEVVPELWHTVTYQTGLVLDGDNALKFLARQFGVPHHLWLTGLVVLGGLVALAMWLRARRGSGASPVRPVHFVYLWLITAVPVVEMITLLEPWRRNPRYLVMVLPWFYLLAAASIEQIGGGVWIATPRAFVSQTTSRLRKPDVAVLPWLLIAALTGLHGYGAALDDLVAYQTPDPAYEEAFQYLAEQRQPGDALLTMSTSAAGVYGQPVDYFAMEQDADQFLLGAGTQPVDRWLGSPWLGSAAELNRVINEHQQTWFVVDTVRLPAYYRGDWLAVVNTQLELAWSKDGALVYRTRPDRVALPSAPNVPLKAELGGVIELAGYYAPGAVPFDESGARVEGAAGRSLPLTLFWKSLAPTPADYTVFIHVKAAGGARVAQRDAQPLDGSYPTSQWRAGETVIDPQPVELPSGLAPGEYALWAGMYRLENLERLPVAGDWSGENAVQLGTLVVR